MGLKDFFKVVGKYAKNTRKQVKLSSLEGFRVAVDISIFLYKAIRSSGDERWIDQFIMFLCKFKKYGIIILCIFDGPNPPKEKIQEQLRRREANAKIVNKLERLRFISKELKKDLKNGAETVNDETIVEIQSLLRSKKGKVDTINYEDIGDVIEGLNHAIDRYSKMTLPIGKEFQDKAMEIVDIMGIAYFKADGEAETLCSQLCIKGHVDAVLSRDTDVLAYRTPIFLYDLDFKDDMTTMINCEELCQELEFTPDQFLDLCILLKCDYNSRIKGYPPDGKNHKKPVCIGWERAFLMIKEYESLEACEEYIEDIKPLKYRRCRKLFSTPKNVDLPVIPYIKPINEKRLYDFHEKNIFHINLTYILETYKPTPLDFSDDDSVESERVDSESEED
jgi:5'-3' exonuclease